MDDRMTDAEFARYLRECADTWDAKARDESGERSALLAGIAEGLRLAGELLTSGEARP